MQYRENMYLLLLLPILGYSGEIFHSIVFFKTFQELPLLLQSSTLLVLKIGISVDATRRREQSIMASIILCIRKPLMILLSLQSTYK